MKALHKNITLAIVSYGAYVDGAKVSKLATAAGCSESKIRRLIKAVHFGKTGWNILPKRKNKPSFRGSGIMMTMQFNQKTLVKGDTCWDADLGDLIWNGKEWISKD